MRPEGDAMADAWVRVPASTSNLGPGFDVLGMALDLFLEARFESGPDPFSIVREGTLAGLDAPPGEDLLFQAMREMILNKPLRHRDIATMPVEMLPSGTLVATSAIPVGRGLGSSAAARAAGRILGTLLARRPVTREEVVAWVAGREGHPDNAAPAVLGGLVASAMSPSGQVRSTPLPVSSRLGWVFAAPGTPLSTREARRVLPDTVPHTVAVRNAGRLALLLPALAAGDGPLLAEVMEDELHVPYRLPLVPGGAAAAAAARAAGAWAVTLSGAGSGLLAVAPPEAAERVGKAMADTFQAVPEAQGGFHHVLRPWLPGATWGAGAPPPPLPWTMA